MLCGSNGVRIKAAFIKNGIIKNLTSLWQKSGMGIRRHISGFTLIELSIVLVIIGLLAAGVLVGRDLIHAAEIRAQIRQFEQYNVAMNTFKTKYNCIAGDCASALDYGLGTAGGDGDNGNGNDQIEATVNEFARGREISNMWYHLSQAQLIEGSFPVGNVPGVNSPPMKLSSQNGGNGAGVNTRGGVWMSAGTFDVTPMVMPIAMKSWLLASSSQKLTSMAPLPAADAYAIDSKMDDGLPFAGQVTVLSNTWGDCSGASCANIAAATTTTYGSKACIKSDVTPPVYNIQATDLDAFARIYLLCAPQAKFQF